MQNPRLHQLISAQMTREQNVYVVRADITDSTGERYEVDYVSRPHDGNGLAPLIRAALVSWIDAGNTLTPYTVPGPAVPERVTARQFKLQLLAVGLIDQVETWVTSQSRQVQIAYANSGTFIRNDPMMESGFTELGFSSVQIDSFYVAAAAL